MPSDTDDSVARYLIDVTAGDQNQVRAWRRELDKLADHYEVDARVTPLDQRPDGIDAEASLALLAAAVDAIATVQDAGALTADQDEYLRDAKSSIAAVHFTLGSGAQVADGTEGR